MKNALDEKKKKLELLRKKRLEQGGKKKPEEELSPRGAPPSSSSTSFFAPPAAATSDLLANVQELLSKTPSGLEPTKSTNGLAGGATSAAARPKAVLSVAQFVQEVEIPPVETITYDFSTQFPEQPEDDSKLIDREEQERLNAEIAERNLREREQQEHNEKLQKEREEEERKRRQLNSAQIKQIKASNEFQDFFKRSSIMIERALNQNDQYDITIDYAHSRTGDDGKGGKSILSKSAFFLDKNRTYNRPITALDWNIQYKELMLAAYAQKEDVLSMDPDGLVLVWSTHMPQRPEYYFTTTSAVLSAVFHPSNPKLIIGGTNSGQVVIWDTREKSTPVNRTSLSSGHTHPLYSLAAIPSVNLLHNIISLSTDGRLCVWNDHDLVEPSTQVELKHDRKDVTTTSFAFPGRDTNSVILGSDEGYLYKARIYESPGIYEAIEAHSAPITGVRFHPLFKNAPRDISDLFLSSSYDWTVKLWSAKISRPLFTFESARDYVYDVQWSPIHPALFAAGDGTGNVDFWDLNKTHEVPIHRVQVLGHSDEENKNDVRDRAISRIKWSDDGKKLAVGASDGSVSVFDVAPEVTKSTDEDTPAFFEKMRKATAETPLEHKHAPSISIDDGADN